ncbi:hypothetical protein AB0I56_40550 [Nonomuraea africana]
MWLVGLGREKFEKVSNNPDTLADVPGVQPRRGRGHSPVRLRGALAADRCPHGGTASADVEGGRSRRRSG